MSVSEKAWSKRHNNIIALLENIPQKQIYIKLDFCRGVKYDINLMLLVGQNWLVSDRFTTGQLAKVEKAIRKSIPTETPKEFNEKDIYVDLKVRHLESGKEEEVISVFKFKVCGQWRKSVLYKGIDRETGHIAVFGRTMEDFLCSFAPV